MIWEIDFARPLPSGSQASPGDVGPHASQVRVEEIEALYLAHWREHCLECAPPHCYQSCKLYEARIDQKCARFVAGIQQNPAYQGLYSFGADIRFRRWAQLSTYLGAGATTPRELLKLQRLHAASVGIANRIADPLQSVDPKRRINGALVVGREKWLRRKGSRSTPEDLRFDELLIEAWNPSEQAFRLIVSLKQGREVFREALDMQPGHNLHRIPFASLNVDLSRREGGLALFPENDAEVRLVFTWLDFVRYRKGPAATSTTAAPAPASQLKCVVWDLDNTLWDGILIEDGAEGVRLRAESVELVKALDARGILQSIASKNDHDVAWALLEKLELAEYFLYPAIHWGPKSGSLKAIAGELNINVDTFALIDDSTFEREEVRSQLPQVRTFPDTEIPGLLDRSELDVPITEASRTRRHSYLAEAKRKRISEAAGGDYLEFLRSCELEAEIFSPESESDRERCYELLQRSNQLNLSTRRYSPEEFDRLIEDPAVLKIATRCRDRFGDYGTIAFASVRLDDGVARLVDYVQSCRVQKKKLEAAWFAWLAAALRAGGHRELHSTFLPTERNHVLLEPLQEVGFAVVRDEPDRKELVLDTDVTPADSGIVALRDAGVRRVAGLTGELAT